MTSREPTGPRSDALSRQLVASVVDYAIIALDGNGHVMSWNPGAERIKGYRPDEIIGKHFSVFYPPEALAAEQLDQKLETAAREGRVAGAGWRLRKDGSRFWADVVITAIRDRKGKCAGFAKVTRESSAQAEMQTALHQNEDRFGLLVRSVKDYAILLLDPEGHVANWNEGARLITGYLPEDIIGTSFERFYPSDAIGAGFPKHELEVAAREGRFEDENWRLRKDGSRYWANVVITALHNDAGELIGYAKVTRDLTERRAAEARALALAAEAAQGEEAMRRSEELADLNQRLQGANRELRAALQEAERARQLAEHAAEAVTEAYRDLDQFAYIASHDLKAPLRGIGNLAQWIEDDIGADLQGDSAEHLRLLRGRVQRMEALIEGILAYSRAGRAKAQRTAVNTDALIRDVLELIAAPEGVEVEIQPRMPTVEAEVVPLQQVFMNLIGNAVKYTHVVRSDARIAIEWRDVGNAFEFSVSDNGPGIAARFHERIWGIFQTLSARDKVEGTGVGLAVVKKIVESRGGRVSVQSVPGQGATFRFTWPKSTREESPA